jgi:hypothetical protein
MKTTLQIPKTGPRNGGIVSFSSLEDNSQSSLENDGGDFRNMIIRLSKGSRSRKELKQFLSQKSLKKENSRSTLARPLPGDRAIQAESTPKLDLYLYESNGKKRRSKKTGSHDFQCAKYRISNAPRPSHFSTTKKKKKISQINSTLQSIYRTEVHKPYRHQRAQLFKLSKSKRLNSSVSSTRSSGKKKKCNSLTKKRLADAYSPKVLHRRAATA